MGINFLEAVYNHTKMNSRINIIINVRLWVEYIIYSYYIFLNFWTILPFLKTVTTETRELRLALNSVLLDRRYLCINNQYLRVVTDIKVYFIARKN